MFSSSTNATLSIVILSWPLIFFLGLDGLWKWRRNSVQNANTFYYLSVLGSTKGLHNWRSIVQNVWTTKKCPKKIENVNMSGWKKFVVNAKEVKFVTTTNEDQSVVLVVENRFARTIYICKKCGGGSICQHQKIRSKCRSCHRGSFCEHEKVRYFCRTCDGSYVCKHLKQKNRLQIAIPLDILPVLYVIVIILPWKTIKKWALQST